MGQDVVGHDQGPRLELPARQPEELVVVLLLGVEEHDVERLLGDAGIVRHRGKIEASIANARATLALREAGTPLPQLVWSHRPADGRAPRTPAEWRASTPESEALSKRLRAAGFRFVGPTTVYATMQACGVVNDHLADCIVRAEVEREIASSTIA